MPVLNPKIKHILSQVQKPARYTGNEWNAWRKDHDGVAVKMVLAFPDLYEVGMSNQGLKILYESVNRGSDMLMERTFAPGTDMEELLRSHQEPLFALESGKPLADFDLVGFSLQYELSYTNVLNMLDLAGIPLHADRRDRNDPLIVGGGPCAFNPEPLAPFFDFFILGEAEECLPELLKDIKSIKEKTPGRKELLARLSGLEGVYVPSIYQPVYSGGKLVALEKKDHRAPSLINKRLVNDLDKAPYPEAPVVPYLQTIHDRAVVELFRGCGRGCRFCQAGYIFRPVRRRSREKIVETARKQIAETGYEEISLASLSSTDYPGLDGLIEELDHIYSGQQVKCNLPSLRLDSYSIKLQERLHRGKRSSLTFAPEAATERLRRVIRKNISEEEIFLALGDAVDAGWQGFKLYFMIGLPTETEADVEAIINLCSRIRQYFRRKAGRKIRISVSVSTFIPKAHTPFQWEPQLPLSEVTRRQEILKNGFKKMPGIDFSWHDPETSYLEAVFARGDRRLASALERAFQLGCRFDGWSEHFSMSLWRQAFEDSGIDPEDYARRRFAYDELLPWDHLDCGISREVFVREHQKAYESDKLVREERNDPDSV